MSLYVPDSAPFSPEQRTWLNDFFARMFGQTATPVANSPAELPAGVEPKAVTILYGSQTGNAEGLASKLARSLAAPLFATTVQDLDSFNRDTLASLDTVVIIASTYGDGEPPDNAQEFHSWILSDAAPQLPNLHYAILALGDSSYPLFCKFGIDIDTRLSQLGAKPIIPRADCDADYDSAYATWRDALVPAIAPCKPCGTPITALPAASGLAFGGFPAGIAAATQAYGKANPYPSKVLRKLSLTGKNSVKETIHVEFFIEGSGMTYEAGDALAVMPRNDEALVDSILKILPFNVNEEVDTDRLGRVSLREALIGAYDITTLNKKFISTWQKFCGHPYLRALVEAGSQQDIDNFCYGRNLYDLVNDYPADFKSGDEFVAILRKQTPRLYSIASSPLAHPGEVHLTVGVVRYEAHGIKRGGVCSTYLADRIANQKPLVFIHQNKNFRLPEDSTKPVIMVGPGTGIAPFRAFIEERAVSGAKGQNWLFFGNPNAESDFLYQDEIKAFEQQGILRCTTAFSRDQANKIYVQDRMREHARELWSWIKNGAYFYVCGDASRMAKDVDTALHQIAMTEGKLTEEAAKAFIADLKKQRRYQRDVY